MFGRGPGGPPRDGMGGRGPMGGGGAFLCNICQQPGHKGEMCPNGQVDWIKKLGVEAFRSMPNQYWSEDPVNPKNRRIVDEEKLEAQAREFAKKKCEEEGLSYDEVQRIAEVTETMTDEQIAVMARQLRGSDAGGAAAGPGGGAAVPPPQDPGAGLPEGWTAAFDAAGRTYFWNRITNLTQWERPVA